MSDLTSAEKRKLERAFGMASGYVLNFSNRTFEEFILDSVGIEIYDEQYSYGSGSKSHRMRALWDIEPNHVVGKVLGDILDEWKEWNQKTYNPSTGEYEEPSFPDDCVKIVERLKSHSLVPEIESLRPNADDKDFEALARSIKGYIKRNEPETGLDRLHTFAVRYIRNLCDKHGISTERSKPLHSAFGEYVKHLRADGVIETEMAERILKSNISVLDAFNKVRNEHSQAHDNPIVSYHEALLIFNNVVSLIRYLDTVEKKTKKLNEPELDILF
ncbi:MAG: abortive infection family protein [Candidatus Electrothrix communis]|nr:MAG: abortive infection family protein [Candidatus Electrothrix communis]